MALILVRHTTPAVAPGTCYGMTDLALADSFEREAAQVARALPPATRIVTSPLGRCVALAERLAEGTGLPLTIEPLWREMDFGTWEGTAWDAIPRAALDGWAEDFHFYRGHGGESVAQLADRVGRAMGATPPGAAVITHAGCIKAALALRGDPEGWQAKPAFGAVIDLRANG